MAYLNAQRKADEMSDKHFDVALTIEVSLKRTKAGDGARLAISGATDAVPMRVEEETDIRDTHPWSYDNLTRQLALRLATSRRTVSTTACAKRLRQNLNFAVKHS